MASNGGGEAKPIGFAGGARVVIELTGKGVTMTITPRRKSRAKAAKKKGGKKKPGKKKPG
jgi:hypothetical protein